MVPSLCSATPAAYTVAGMAPSRRRHLIAAVVGLIATVAAAGAFQLPGRAAPAPEPEPDPTVSASPSTPPPPPPPRVAVTARDIGIGAGYWQGAAETYPLTVVVRNTGRPAVDAITQVFLPVGVRRAGVTAPNCAVDGLSIDCPIGPGDAARITVDVTVAPGLWRDPPVGTVRTTATATDTRPVSEETTFGLNFPPGPPTPGIDLSVSDPFLPTDPIDPTAGTEPTILEIRLANTGSVQADGAVDVVTAPGVSIATVPAQCTLRLRVSADRERCQLGRVPAGQRATLRFGLVVTRAARAEAPLLGSVHAALTPTGQDTATVVASYRVVITDRPTDEAGPPADGDPPVTVAEPRRGPGIGGAGATGHPASSIGQALSVLPMLISIVGVFAVLASMVIVSIRRRSGPD
jgi:hypothetical protein